MEIRPAGNDDIPAVVDLLKISLGEDLMPKSEAYWRWKHIVNPFGPSPVVICLEKDKIVGVRAFMRWEWVSNGKVFKALRAVDTATHPEFQGKGIFKKLTLSLVESSKKQGDDFIFNTPNSQSKPGYLKMGWQEAGRLPVKISVQRPVAMLKSFLKQSTGSNIAVESPIEYFLNHPGLADLIEVNRRGSDITTNVSAEYLRWRYLKVPVASYVAVGDEEGKKLRGLIIGRIKQTKLGRELRITNIFTAEKSPAKLLVQRFHECRKSWNISYCTVSGLTAPQGAEFLGRLSFRAGAGPIVTVRSLNVENLQAFKNFKEWSPSLGDLELF